MYSIKTNNLRLSLCFICIGFVLLWSTSNFRERNIYYETQQMHHRITFIKILTKISKRSSIIENTPSSKLWKAPKHIGLNSDRIKMFSLKFLGYKYNFSLKSLWNPVGIILSFSSCFQYMHLIISSGENLVHNISSVYEDHTYQPTSSGKPSARLVSNALFRQNSTLNTGGSYNNRSAFFAFFGK